MRLYKSPREITPSAIEIHQPKTIFIHPVDSSNQNQKRCKGIANKSIEYHHASDVKLLTNEMKNTYAIAKTRNSPLHMAALLSTGLRDIARADGHYPSP
jgi:hypothetical protein